MKQLFFRHRATGSTRLWLLRERKQMRWAPALDYYLEAVSRIQPRYREPKQLREKRLQFRRLRKRQARRGAEYNKGGRCSKGKSQEICQGVLSNHWLSPHLHVFGWNSSPGWVKNYHKALGHAMPRTHAGMGIYRAWDRVFWRESSK